MKAKRLSFDYDSGKSRKMWCCASDNCGSICLEAVSTAKREICSNSRSYRMVRSANSAFAWSIGARIHAAWNERANYYSVNTHHVQSKGELLLCQHTSPTIKGRITTLSTYITYNQRANYYSVNIHRLQSKGELLLCQHTSPTIKGRITALSTHITYNQRANYYSVNTHHLQSKGELLLCQHTSPTIKGRITTLSTHITYNQRANYYSVNTHHLQSKKKVQSFSDTLYCKPWDPIGKNHWMYFD